LILSNNILYGTARFGGSSANGTIFKLNTDGSGFTILHSFTAASGLFSNVTNSDGVLPSGRLALSGNTLYGAVPRRVGTVFKLSTDGSGFDVLYSFPAMGDGAYPNEVLLSGTTLYGTAIPNWFHLLVSFSHEATGMEAGYRGNGTVFSISFPPALSLFPSGTNVLLSWPTNYAGFDYAEYTLQSCTTVSRPVWSTVTNLPFAVNGLNTVTNPVSVSQQFFRLRPRLSSKGRSMSPSVSNTCPKLSYV
jgi:uncharacterized repeat protein (TIGR03803 family)